MSAPAAIAPWRGGADLDVLAPFCSPSDLFDAGPVVVLLASDVDALAYAATTGAELFLRTTPRAQRARSLTSRPPVASPQLATSVDALGSDILRRELLAERAEAPWCLWWPESLEPSQPGHRGRAERLAIVRAGFTGGLLRRWSDGTLAPPETAYLAGQPGALRLGDASLGVATGRAIGRGQDAAWTKTAARAGQARRPHDLADPFPRAWRSAESALRDEEAGVDLLPSGGAGLPRGRTLIDRPAGPWSLAVPRGAAVGWSGAEAPRDAVAAPPVDGAGWAVCSLEDPRHAEGLESAEGLRGLRPTWLQVRVADQHRFRPPFVDREPEYRELHRIYTAAMTSWDLPQRVQLALSDRGPRDLVALARALDCEPAWLADVLLALADDGLLAATLHRRGPGGDWQASDFGTPGSTAAPDPRLAELLTADGCRAQLLAEALVVPDPGACGLCDHCAPGDGWTASLDLGAVRDSGPLAHAPSSASALDLGSLFSGLGSGPDPAPTPTPAARPQRPTSVPVLSPEAPDEDLDEAVTAHGAASLWVAAAFQYRGPSAGRPLPGEARAALLAVLLDGSAEVEGATVHHADGGRIHIHLRGGPARGAHQFRPRGLDGSLLSRLAARDEADGALRTLADRRAEEAARAEWLESVDVALGRWLTTQPGLPPADSLPQPAQNAWLDGEEAILRTLRLLTAPEQLAAAGRDLLGRRGSLDSLPARLALRALFEDPPAALRPDEAERWLSGPEAPVPDLLARIEGGSRRAWARLLTALDEDHLDAGIDAAVSAGLLPVDRAERALASAEGVVGEAAVRGALPAPAEPGPAWRAAWGDRSLAEQDAAVDAFEAASSDAAGVWAEAGRTFRAQVARDATLRQAICADHGAGRLAAAFAKLSERGAPEGPHFVPSDEEAATFAAIRTEAAQEQRAFTPALARGLAAGALGEGTVGQAGVQALADAAAAGWGGSMVALLRGQVRRHPQDAARRAWLGRALLEVGRWTDAQAEFAEADRLLGGEAGLDLRWWALERVLADASPSDSLGWLEGLVRRGPAREISRRIALLAWGKTLPADVVAPLGELLRNEGSGVWAGAMKALQQR